MFCGQPPRGGALWYGLKRYVYLLLGLAPQATTCRRYGRQRKAPRPVGISQLSQLALHGDDCLGDFPTAAILLADVLVSFGAVRRLEVLGVPVETFANAVGNVP